MKNYKIISINGYLREMEGELEFFGRSGFYLFKSKEGDDYYFPISHTIIIVLK